MGLAIKGEWIYSHIFGEADQCDIETYGKPNYYNNFDYKYEPYN